MLVSIGSAGTAKAAPRSGLSRKRRRAGQVTGVFGAAVTLTVALSACTPPPSSNPAAARGSPGAAASGTSCAWPTELTAQANNTAFPDAASAVWVQPIVASAGSRIVVSGRFPDARYASIDVYTPRGVGASLPDYRIAPQPGSTNPWQHQAAPGGRFTVTVDPAPAAAQANTLPLPAGTTSQHPPQLEFYQPPQSTFSHGDSPTSTPPTPGPG